MTISPARQGGEMVPKLTDREEGLVKTDSHDPEAPVGDTTEFYVDRLREQGCGDIADYVSDQLSRGNSITEVFNDLDTAVRVIRLFHPRL